MSEINYQALREAAERATPAMERLLMLPVDDDLISEQELKDSGVDIDALNAFKFLAGPETVLALLDERERNQQYIKRRDQENEDIALTVGKLRVELEAAEKRIAELEAEPVSNSDELPLDYLQGHKDGLEWAAQLAEANHPQTGDWLYDDPIDLARAIRKGPDMPTVQAGNYPVIPDSWISCSERMPNDAQWCVVDAEDGYYVQCWSEGQGWLGDDISLRNCDVIRWMPIPEPPQQDGE
ncbi:TPA: ead/Ea22-like family protein [Escherichia coli]|nr:ead/Ea22-like family protein [Escherichia coli]HBN6662825.1 ead/Ea22-like family protein [Escherichia coli]HCP3210780.1 ead/Ea22-like family protein [Escherichia coli]HCP4357762.1 ead/Ea22-like family protein [Escherichia coli]HCP4445881.1 ead/Ea22-like family protein [Escherichia coli]